MESCNLCRLSTFRKQIRGPSDHNWFTFRDIASYLWSSEGEFQFNSEISVEWFRPSKKSNNERTDGEIGTSLQGLPGYLMPFFCLQVFDFCIYCLTVVSYVSYIPNIKTWIQAQVSTNALGKTTGDQHFWTMGKVLKYLKGNLPNFVCAG